MNTVTRTDLRKAYDAKGYVIVRNAIDPGLAAEMVDHIHWLGHKYPGVDNAYAERPRFISGEHMPFQGCEMWNVV